MTLIPLSRPFNFMMLFYLRILKFTFFSPHAKAKTLTQCFLSCRVSVLTDVKSAMKRPALK